MNASIQIVSQLSKVNLWYQHSQLIEICIINKTMREYFELCLFGKTLQCHKEISWLESQFFENSIVFSILLGSRAIKWRKYILMNCKIRGPNWYKNISWIHNWWKIFMLRLYLYRSKWNENDIFCFISKTIFTDETFSFPYVKSQLTDIIWIYWGLLHSFITWIFSMKYITWHI